MFVCCVNHCAYCRAPIAPGERWVREKIYDPALSGRDPSYHRYHAEPFVGQEASCWERHQMEMEIGRTNAYAAQKANDDSPVASYLRPKKEFQFLLKFL